VIIILTAFCRCASQSAAVNMEFPWVAQPTAAQAGRTPTAATPTAATVRPHSSPTLLEAIKNTIYYLGEYCIIVCKQHVTALAEAEGGQLHCPKSQALASSGQGAITQIDGMQSTTAAPQGSGRDIEGIEKSEDCEDSKDSASSRDSKSKSRSCRNCSCCRHPRYCNGCSDDIEGNRGSEDIDGCGDYDDCDNGEGSEGSEGSEGYQRLGVELGERQQRPTACSYERLTASSSSARPEGTAHEGPRRGIGTQTTEARRARDTDLILSSPS
jgi:hypothetical protein